jgi:hypothetical protein
MALTAIRKSNYRHFISLFAVVPHTKEHIQNNFEKVNGRIIGYLASLCGKQTSGQ